METHINTYKLNQGDKEYILTTSMVKDTIRITCKNALNDNFGFSKDFTLEELGKLDPIFGLIKSPYEGLGYIDKALKKQKVGISEDGENLKINFYISNPRTHNLEIPSMNNFNGVNTTLAPTEISSNFGVNEKLNLGQDSAFEATFNNSEEQDEKYLNNIKTEDFSQFNTINTIGANFGTELVTEYPTTSKKEVNYQDTQYSNYYTTQQNIDEINDNIGQFTYDYSQINSQYTTNGPFDTTTELGNIEGTNLDMQYTQDFKSQYIAETQNLISKDQFSTNSQINQYTKKNEYESNIINKKEDEPTTTTKILTLPLLKSNEESLDLQTQSMPKESPIQEEKINKINGTITTLQSDHQLIQDRVNVLAGQINSYKNQLSAFSRARAENEVNNLKAENMAIKQQLSELNNLRNDAAEVKFLKSQLYELNALRKKVAELDSLKGKLGEMNTLRAKAAELDSVKIRFNELNNLKIQVSQMGQIKHQLTELNTLKAKLAKLNTAKLQLEELNNLRAQIGQINALKQQIDELTNRKMNNIDLEKFRRKINELEKIKLEYELEIKQLKEDQIRSSNGELISSIERTKNIGMESRQLFFEDRPEQIYVKGEIIHNTDELELLTRKINKLNQKLTLNLLYKATADSDKAEIFHEKCDDAKSTLVLVETDKGKRFGGYTTCSWSGDCIDKKDEDAFVFSLDKMEVYENIPGEDAIGCYPKYGPIFLGCQIRIYDNAFTKGGTTFEKGLNYNTEEDFELTGGDRVFNIKEIEVYEVIHQ